MTREEFREYCIKGALQSIGYEGNDDEIDKVCDTVLFDWEGIDASETMSNDFCIRLERTCRSVMEEEKTEDDYYGYEEPETKRHYKMGKLHTRDWKRKQKDRHQYGTAPKKLSRVLFDGDWEMDEAY